MKNIWQEVLPPCLAFWGLPLVCGCLGKETGAGPKQARTSTMRFGPLDIVVPTGDAADEAV